MLKTALIIVCLCLLTSVGIAGVSWKAIWMEPFEVIFQPGQSAHYSIKGMRLGDVVVDITSAPELKVSSADQTILGVNLQDHTLIAKKTGHTQIQISFGQITVIYEAYVNPTSKK